MKKSRNVKRFELQVLLFLVNDLALRKNDDTNFHPTRCTRTSLH